MADQTAETKVEDKVEDKSTEDKVEDKTAVKVEAKVEDKAKTETDEKAEKPKPWFEQRIGTLTYEKNELLRQGGSKDLRIAELEQQINALKAGSKTDTTAGDMVPKAEVSKLAKEEAGRLAAIQVFNDKCDTTFDKGVREYKDFQSAVDTYKELGGANPQFLSSVLESDEPHRVFYELAKDKDEAARIMSLPPVRQAAAIAKFEARLAAPKRSTTKTVSDAPNPVKDVTRAGNANGSINLEDNNVDMRDWVREREKQLKDARR